MLSAEEARFGTTLGNIHWELQEMKFTLKYTQPWPKNNQVHPKTVNVGVSMSQFWHIKNVLAWQRRCKLIYVNLSFPNVIRLQAVPQDGHASEEIEQGERSRGEAGEEAGKEGGTAFSFEPDVLR